MRAENSKYERTSSASGQLDSIHAYLLEFCVGPQLGELAKALPIGW